MAVNIPDGYQQVMVYLILHDPKTFIDFTQTVFSATEKMRHERDGEIAHAEINIGSCCIMMGKSNDQYSVMNAGLFVYVDNADESYRKALSAGAKSVMEPADQEYGRTCGIVDPTGNTWWITSVNK